MRATDICVAVSLAFGWLGSIPPSIAAETITDPEQSAVTLACGSSGACIADAGGGDVARVEPVMDASNTGVPEGTTITRRHTGTLTITTDNTVVDGWEITGNIIVRAKNVTIKNCTITFSNYWGIDAEGAKNITIQNCDIIGPGYGAASNSAILGSGNFIGNDISKVENGIVLQDGASVVKGNYIHDLQAPGSDPHYDGIAVQGGQNGVLIEGNTILARDTSNIIIQDYFGPVNDVTISHNYLGGTPGINVYVEGRFGNGTTNVRITDNVIEKAYYDYFSIVDSSPVISGNIQFLPGQMPTLPDHTPGIRQR